MSSLLGKRLHTFDFFRGFFLILAFIQHYTYHLNFALMNFKQDWFGGIFHYPFAVEKVLPCSPVKVPLMTYFGPWVTQIFLSLACFNLYMKFHDKLNWHEINKYLKKLAFLYLIFFFEALVVSDNLGPVLIPGPIQTWFLVLGITLILLKFFNYKIYTFLCIGLGLFVFTPWFTKSLTLANTFLISSLGLGENLACNPFIFMISSWIGVSMAKLVRSEVSKKEILSSLCISLLLASLFGKIAPPYRAWIFDAYAFEYFWAYNLSGSLCVWFVIATVLFLGIYLEKINKPLCIPLFSFISHHSLLLFLFHQIFFIFLAIPLRVLLTPIFGELENSLKMTLMGIIGYILTYYLVSRSHRTERTS